MATVAGLRLPTLAERLWDFKQSLRLKRNISPSVRWISVSSLSFNWECSKFLSPKSCTLSRKRRLNGTANLTFGHGYLCTTTPVLQAPVVQVPGSLPEPVDPFKLAEADLANLYGDIRRELWTHRPHLEQISSYYFDGHGKAFRPVMVVLMARAVNQHIFNSNRLLDSQLKIAMIAEMIHTASLVHDDVIDTSDTRRGKPSVNVLWGQKKAILAGDFILSQAARILARIGNEDVIYLLSQVLLDLVQGEFMQLGSKEDEGERFTHYLQKTFKKTASLTAYTCKAASVLGGAGPEVSEAAFQYGRNIGIAFQLIDDLLDFISSQAEMGKPAAADLKLGLATAPVLFACEKFPELNPMIMRRFSAPEDVERAYDAVLQSDGLAHTRMLARKHCDEALKCISILTNSAEKQALIAIAEKVLNRSK